MNGTNPVAARRGDVPAERPAESDEHRDVNGKAMAVNFLLTAVFDIGLAIVAFRVAKHLGASDPVAYLACGIGPLTMQVITWIRAKTVSGSSVIVLLILCLSAVAAFIGGADSRLLIIKDSVITGGFGLACLASLLFPKPLMFYFGAKFATDGTAAGLRYWAGLWRHPSFRRSQYTITILWGTGYLVEAVLRIVIAYTVTSFQVANAISSILPWLFLGGLIFATIGIGKRTRQAAARSTRVGP
jgi:hypothetical protein